MADTAAPGALGTLGTLGTVAVDLPSTLAGLADDRRHHELPLTGVTTVAGVLDVLAGRYPVLVRRLRDETGALRRYVNLYVDGEDVRALAGAATPVGPGQALRVIASVAGG